MLRGLRTTSRRLRKISKITDAATTTHPVCNDSLRHLYFELRVWYINRNMNPWHPAHLLAIGLGPLMVITTLINTPSGRTTLACLSGFFLILGTAIYYLHGWSTGPLVGAWAYSIGFSGLLGVDLSQIWAYKAAGVSVPNPFLLSAFGFISLLLGSVCAISALDRMDDPFDRFGNVCWQLGSMAVMCSQMWKVYRILKASEGGIVELTAFLMESFFFIGAALFYYGCNLYDASERAEEEAEEEGIHWEPSIRPTTINHIWLIGCLFFTIGPTYSLYCGYSIENLAYTVCGWLFVLGTTTYYSDWELEDLVGATCYLLGCAGYVYFDGLYLLAVSPEEISMRVNQGISVLGDFLYFFGSIGFEPAVEELGYPWDRMGIEGFINGSLCIVVSQAWKMIRLLRNTKIRESVRAALASETSVGIGAVLFGWGALKLDFERRSGDFEGLSQLAVVLLHPAALDQDSGLPREVGINHLFLLSCVFFVAAPLRTAIKYHQNGLQTHGARSSVLV